MHNIVREAAIRRACAWHMYRFALYREHHHHHHRMVLCLFRCFALVRNLTDSGIHAIDPGTFDDQGAVISLILSENALQSIEPTTFSGLSQLVLLYGSHCGRRSCDGRQALRSVA